jgi:hypothetical protein
MEWKLAMAPRNRLTTIEHAAIGPAINAIRNTLDGPDLRKLTKRNRQMEQHRRKAARQVEHLRCKLDGLLYKQCPDATFPPSPYYGADAKTEPAELAATYDRDVLEPINGRVLANVIDTALKGLRALQMLHSDLLNLAPEE